VQGSLWRWWQLGLVQERLSAQRCGRGEHARASWAEPLRRAPHSAVCRRRGGAWQISSSGGDWSGSELVVTRPTGLARHARALREQSSGATGRG
jgi:hypothetical protein